MSKKLINIKENFSKQMWNYFKQFTISKPLKHKKIFILEYYKPFKDSNIIKNNILKKFLKNLETFFQDNMTEDDDYPYIVTLKYARQNQQPAIIPNAIVINTENNGSWLVYSKDEQLFIAKTTKNNSLDATSNDSNKKYSYIIDPNQFRKLTDLNIEKFNEKYIKLPVSPKIINK